MIDLEVELVDSKDFGPCDCCGENSRTVWGFVHRGDTTVSAYFVHWALGKVAENGAHIDLIVGRWGTGAGPEDRTAVSLVFRRGIGVTVIDCVDRHVARSPMVGRGLRRDEVIGTYLAKTVFELIDTIWLRDERIAEVVGKTP